MVTIHATCVAVDGMGVLLRGPSGAGKSDLALRLIDSGARLVADDQVSLDHVGAALLASAPEALAGLLEVRGIGIVRLAHLQSIDVGLLVDLDSEAEIDRMPMPDEAELLGIRLPRIRLRAFEASAPAKLRLVARGLELHSED